jgi:hypothetical protein
MAREAARFNRVAIGRNSRSINAFAQGMNGGLIVTGSPAAVMGTELPAVYPSPFYCPASGLICYQARSTRVRHFGG